jgi:diaminopimelate decarboxylase
VKANSNPKVLEIIFSEGFGADASSEAEAWIAQELGATGMYTGNYTTEDEFRFVLQQGLFLNLDDVSMLPTIERIGVPEFLSFRVNPGISKGGMSSLFLAGPDAKFGVPVEQVAQAYLEARDIGVRRFGIHMMTGSNVLEERYFIEITRRLLDIAGDVHSELGIDFERVNIGGGFGVPYRPTESSLDLDAIAEGIREVFDDHYAGSGREEPILMAEPGRLIAADAGWLVTRANVIKDGAKRFIGVDAGMNDLPRPAIYDAYHYITVLGKPADGDLEKVSVVGRLCENNDQFARDRILPPIEVGDFLVIHNAGAHAYAMGHNYNNRPRSAEYLIRKDGAIEQIRRAETIEDLFSGTDI